MACAVGLFPWWLAIPDLPPVGGSAGLLASGVFLGAGGLPGGPPGGGALVYSEAGVVSRQQNRTEQKERENRERGRAMTQGREGY